MSAIRIPQHRRRRWHHSGGRPIATKRSGATLVEFAIVSNLLFLLIFGCMELARLNMARNLAQDAAYYAARVAMVPGATEAEARAEANRLMGSLFDGGYEVNCSSLDQQAEEITVTVTVNFDDLAFFVPMFMGGVTFDSAVTMKTERYNGFFEAN